VARTSVAPGLEIEKNIPPRGMVSAPSRELKTCIRPPARPLRDLRAASLAMMRAEHEVRELYRQREIARARAAQRDPALR
jgi:hypothetical protein